MKKKICIFGGIILIVLIIAGIITNYADSGRVTTGHEPKYCIKIVSNDGNKVTYWGLGYKVVRYVAVSPNEPYKNNIGVKMGSWLMKYELPKVNSIEIEYEGQIITVTHLRDIGTIENILLNSKYNNEICDGIETHKITLNNDVYYIKGACKEIQKGDKQARISKEDLEIINNIISTKMNSEKKSASKEIDETTIELKQKGETIFGKDYCTTDHSLEMAGSALTEWECELCGTSAINSDTNTPKLCENCAIETGRCNQCGKLK